MDLFKDDLDQEFIRIKEKLERNDFLSESDLKIILLSVLREEDLNESKQ
jgi:hypothetical protein